MSFDYVVVVPEASSKISISYATEIVEAFKSPLITDPPKSRLIPWSPPPTGILKLNIDGCWYDNNRKAGFGGISRNDHGDWEMGYYGCMWATSSLEAEIWSIYRGLTIILEKGWVNMQIESDSQTVVILFNDGASDNHPQTNILKDGNYILSRTECTLTHTYRSANECAYCLARIGAEQDEDLVVTTSPPRALREFLIRDGLNIRQILD